jgi:hypothetical protein
LIFSTVYTVVFFMSIGCMSGAVEKAEQALEKAEISSYELSAILRFNITRNLQLSVLEQFR